MEGSIKVHAVKSKLINLKKNSEKKKNNNKEQSNKQKSWFCVILSTIEEVSMLNGVSQITKPCMY